MFHGFHGLENGWTIQVDEWTMWYRNLQSINDPMVIDQYDPTSSSWLLFIANVSWMFENCTLDHWNVKLLQRKMSASISCLDERGLMVFDENNTTNQQRGHAARSGPTPFVTFTSFCGRTNLHLHWHLHDLTKVSMNVTIVLELIFQLIKLIILHVLTMVIPILAILFGV